MSYWNGWPREWDYNEKLIWRALRALQRFPDKWLSARTVTALMDPPCHRSHGRGFCRALYKMGYLDRDDCGHYRVNALGVRHSRMNDEVRELMRRRAYRPVPLPEGLEHLFTDESQALSKARKESTDASRALER